MLHGPITWESLGTLGFVLLLFFLLKAWATDARHALSMRRSRKRREKRARLTYRSVK